MNRFLFVVSMCLAVNAIAQTERVVQEADRVVTAKKSRVDFTEVPMTGTIVGPEGGYEAHPPRAGFKNLIPRRANFNPELQKSVDSL